MARLSPPRTVDGIPLTIGARSWYGRALNVTDRQGLSVEDRRDIARKAFDRVSTVIDGRWSLTVGQIADGRFLPRSA